MGMSDGLPGMSRLFPETNDTFLGISRSFPAANESFRRTITGCQGTGELLLGMARPLPGSIDPVRPSVSAISEVFRTFAGNSCLCWAERSTTLNCHKFLHPKTAMRRNPSGSSTLNNATQSTPAPQANPDPLVPRAQNNLNVAFFASAFYPHLGGVEELVRQLAHAYRKAGMNPIVVTNRWPPSLPAHEEYEGIPVYRLTMRGPEGSWKNRLKYQLTHRAVRKKMLDLLVRHRIDLLHVQCVSINGYYALLARQALRLPLVVSAQGELTMDADRLYERSPFMNQMLRKLLRKADHITACSGNTLAELEQYYGAPFGERASVVYNGIELDNFTESAPYSHSRPYILGIGRLVPQKGFDLLLRAFAQCGVRDHDLLLAGEGTERVTLERLAGELGIQERVRFLGRADRPTAVSLFTGCAFFVLPSRHEPMGIVNLEAMAAGKAVLAAHVGGVPEIVLDGKTGRLFPAENVDCLAAGIAQFASDPDLCMRFGQAGQARSRQFAWPAIAEQYQEVYRAALASNGKQL